MKKAVIYARYSSSSQTEQSIEGQIRVCTDFAKQHDFLIVDTYIDRAMTGTNDRRPEFQRMLRDSSEHNWEFVIVYAVDRFGRNDEDYAINKRTLSKNGVSLLSATQITSKNIDGTDNINGILSEGILVALAKYYSAELSQKVKRGQKESLAKGNFLGSFVPYGYDVVDKKYVINETEAEIVRMMYVDYAKGLTAKEIAENLKERGIRNKFGRYFVVNSIMNMLKNEKYNGTLIYGDNVIRNYIPVIIEDSLFEKVQARIVANKRSPARMKAKEEYLLSSKLYCGYCGSLMTGESGTSKTGAIHHYYKCFGKKKGSDCKKKNYKKDALEDLVVNLTIRHILNEKNQCPIIDRIVTIYNNNLKNSAITTSIKKQIDAKHKEIDNILKAIKLGIFTDSTKNELLALENEVKELEEKFELQLAIEEKPLDSYRIKYWFSRFNDIDNADKKRVIIGSFVRKVILYDNKIIIIYNHDGDNQKEYHEDELEEIECSNLTQLAPPISDNPNFIFTPHYFALVYWFED